MGKLSLRTIYLATLSALLVVSFVVFTLFDMQSQQKQTEEALLEEARTFAREMDAVWQFMDNQQKVINTSSDGDYDFKGLHCSIVGKSVGAIFSAGNDYTIRYTNFSPRSVIDTPDSFEAEALLVFERTPLITEYYGIAEYEGAERFRYLQVLEVDESCLECHGEPAGELDVTGHEKEGWTLDSMGGAISIVIPLDQQWAAMRENVLRDAMFFLVITVIIVAVVYLVTTFFVFRPLTSMGSAFGQMGEGRLHAEVDGGRTAKEVAQVIRQFNHMAGELRATYAHLEEQVADRTRDLQEANATLEQQRDHLEQLTRKLAQEAQFKTDLLSMVNHELRTPLTSIITLAQIALDECEATRNRVVRRQEQRGADGTCGTLPVHPAERDLLNSVDAERHAWEEIQKNSNILLEMINNMLDIARSDAGGMRATCEPMDLGDVVMAVRTPMIPLAQKYSVHFRTQVASDVPLVMGDYEKTQRILENLVSNAIKFTPDGGTVRLGISCSEETGDVLVCVADTGIGIAPEDQERIFERFVQVDGTSTRKYNGSGLGLALVKEYAAIQGYEVSVESQLGEGTTFTVRIPCALAMGGDE